MRTIPFSPPDISDAEIREVVETLKSGWITTGPRTKEFERKISEYIGTNRTVCLNSDTAALELTLRILGIGPGDEVITTAYTYTASAAIIEHVGARIVMVDTMPDAPEINYEQVEAAVTERTKAIIPVDIAGVMCDYRRLHEIADSKSRLFRAKNELQQAYNRMLVIADSAHGFGARFDGVRSGNQADFTCFSFHAVKNLTTAEGGAVTWKSTPGIEDAGLYRQYMLYSLHGQGKDALAKTAAGSWEYDISLPGFKCNMTDLQAAIGLKQLERYDALLARRRTIVERYQENLRGFPVAVMKHIDAERESSCHLLITRIGNADEPVRNEIIRRLAERGVATNVHYKPLPMFTAYKDLGFNISNFPNAFALYENEITLPLHTGLSDSDVDYVCDSLTTVLQEAGLL